MSYWTMVLKRAAWEAAKAVKLDSIEGVLMVGGGQAMTALVLWWVSKDIGIGARIAACLLPFLLWPLVFLTRLLTVPPAMARERDAVVGQLQARLDSDADVRAKRRALAVYIQQGEMLMARCRDPNDTSLHDDAEDWAKRAETTLLEVLDDSYIPRFRSATGTPSNIIIGPGAQEHGAYWSEMRNRVFRLQEFTREVTLPGQPQPPSPL